MLPVSLLKTAQCHPINEETYNGHAWMNVHLREVICTSKDGDRVSRLRECYIRLNTSAFQMSAQVQVIDKGGEETTRNRLGSHLVSAVEEQGVERMAVGGLPEALDVAKMMEVVEEWVAGVGEVDLGIEAMVEEAGEGMADKERIRQLNASIPIPVN